MTRIRTDNVFGTLTDNPLTSGATTMNSAGLANLAAVAGSDRAVLTLDPNRVGGAPEIVYVTAHTGSATSATILRGQEGTAARQHASGTFWVHAPTALDLGLGVLGYAQVTAAQTLTAAADLTGLSVAVTVGSGRRVRVTGQVLFDNNNAAANRSDLLIRESGVTLQDGLLGLTASGARGENGSINAQVVLTPSSGAHTYNLRGEADLYNIEMFASATIPAFILVEDIGAA